MKILITGGTGLVGRYLTAKLLSKGYQVAYLSRKKERIANVEVFQWNIEKGYIEEGALKNVDYIIHLAGAGIADKRWSEERKKEIINSRVKPVQLLANELSKQNIQLKGFISASAIGFYGGDTGETEITENSTNGSDFLADCTKQWEDVAYNINAQRIAFIRIGIVLSNEGGALPKLVQPIRYFIGSPLGSGKQWMSWIHIEDLCNIFVEAIENNTMHGAYNAVASNPVRNQELTQAAAKVLKKPLFMPNVPSFLLKILFGEMAVVVLGGNKVSNKKLLQETNFQFQYEEIEAALMDLLR